MRKGKKNHKYNLGQYLGALGALVMLSACNEPTTFVPTNTDNFVYDNQDSYAQADELLQADYLIVPDFSWSMRASKSELEDALEQFAGYLASEDIDYKVAFARGTTQSTGFAEQYIPNTFLGSVIRPASSSAITSQVAEQLAELAAPNAPNERVLMETALRVLRKQAASFLRNEAQLVLVFISDNDDESKELLGDNRTHDYYLNEFKKFKSNNAYISARTFGVHTELDCDPHSYGSANSTRLINIANQLDSLNDGFRCLDEADELADSLENLARDVSKPTNRFLIQGPAYPDSIEVRVAGEVIESSEETWLFNESTNEIVFADDAKPDASESVEIRFDMIMKLSQSPKVSTINVLKNKSSIPQSEANGWSYDENTREIRLNGSAAADQNDRIEVSYEVQ